MADYVLSAKITGNATSFEKAFATAQNTVKSFESNIQNIGTKLSSVGDSLTSKITKPAAIATSALAGITLVKGFDRLVGIDTAQAKLKALGHDAESVEQIMDSALTSVKGTAFGLDEAATVAANAVAAGINPGKELTKYLTMTADAASIAGISMSEMGSILNKVQTGQTVYTEDLEQLADRGLPVYQWLAEEAGVAASEVKSLASEGQISSEMLYNAIDKNIGGAAQIMGETSFTAAVDNIGASIGRIGANFLDAGGKGGGFFSQLKPLMAEFNDELGGLEDKASELGEKFGAAFANVVRKIKNVYTGFKNLSPSIQDVIIKATSFGTVFLVSLGPILKITGRITQGVGGMISAFKKFNSAVKIMNGARAAVKNYQVATEGASIAAGVMNGNLTKQQAVVGGLANKVGGLVTKIGGLAISNPWIAAAAGAALLVTGIVKVVEAFNAEETAAKRAAAERDKATEKSVASAQSQAMEAENYLQKLKELEGVENKTTAQKELMKAYVDKLNESVEGLNLSYDEEADKLSETTDAIHNKIQAQKEEAIQAAYLKQSKQALEDYAETQIKVTDKQNELSQKQEKYNELMKKGSSLTYDELQEKSKLGDEVSSLKDEIDGLTNAQSMYLQESIKATNQAAIQSGAFDKLLKAAGKTGKDLPQSLVNGINEGKYVIPESVEDLDSLITFDSLATKATGGAQKMVDALALKMQEGKVKTGEAATALANTIDFESAANKAGLDGTSIVTSLTNSVNSGQITVQEANTRLNNLITFTTAVQKAGMDGTSIATNLATQIANGEISVDEATKQLTNAVTAETGKTPAKTGADGSAAGGTFASGIYGQRGNANSAGLTVANSAKNATAGVSLYNNGYNMGAGLASGLRGAVGLVKAAARTLADACDAAIQKKEEISSPSRKWRDFFGFNMGKGLAIGLEKSANLVKRAGLYVSDVADESIEMKSISSISQDVSVNHAIRTAKANMQTDAIDVQTLGDYIIAGITEQGTKIAEALEKGVSNIRMVPNDRNMARYIGKLGFERS